MMFLDTYWSDVLAAISVDATGLSKEPPIKTLGHVRD
jgi:hypothetical protein